MAKDCREQIDRSRKRLANCLNLLEAIHDDLGISSLSRDRIGTPKSSGKWMKQR